MFPLWMNSSSNSNKIWGSKNQFFCWHFLWLHLFRNICTYPFFFSSPKVFWLLSFIRKFFRLLRCFCLNSKIKNFRYLLVSFLTYYRSSLNFFLLKTLTGKIFYLSILKYLFNESSLIKDHLLLKEFSPVVFSVFQIKQT